VKRFCLCFLAALILIALCGCGTDDIPELTVTHDEAALQSARQYFKNAALIVSGTCVNQHTNAKGQPCSDLSIGSVIAGNAKSKEVIHCENSNMGKNLEYLLYLAPSGDVNYAEDMVGFTVVSGNPLHIVDGAVTLEGQKLLVSDIIRDIEENLNSIITAPAQYYYYDSLAKLIEASDDIFIGRVDKLPPIADLKFRSRESGAGVENEAPASVAKIRALGSIKGAFVYGDAISMIYAPNTATEMLDAAALTPFRCDAASADILKEGGIYLFFLTKGPDSKQDYYFAASPVQGAVKLDGENILPAKSNKALTGYTDLPTLVSAIKANLAAQ